MAGLSGFENREFYEYNLSRAVEPLALPSACPKINHWPIQALKSKQNIAITIDIKLYGNWNGSHVVGMEWQQLEFTDLKHTFEKINITEYLSSNDSLPYFELTTDSYEENRNYSAVVIWTSNNKDSRNKTNSPLLKVECSRNTFLDTSKWMCSKNNETISREHVCDGYKFSPETPENCKDTSDESYLVCTVPLPYQYIVIFVFYIIVGMISFIMSKALIYKYCSCLFSRSSTSSDIEMSTKPALESPYEVASTELVVESSSDAPLTKPALESPTEATSLVNICLMSNKEMLPGEIDDTLKQEASRLYRPCASDPRQKKSLFKMICTLSLHLPLRDMMLKFTEHIIKIECHIHKKTAAEYITCLRFCTGEESYVSKFIRDAIEKDSCPSRFIRNISSCMRINSEIWSLRITIAVHFIKALLSIILFYQDNLKDVLVLKILAHIDDKVLTSDTDPSEEFNSVGGLNFHVLIIYVAGILIFSECMIHGYVFKNRDVIPLAFKRNHSPNSYKWLVIVFPIIFIAMEIFLVNVQLTMITFKIKMAFKHPNKTKEEEAHLAKVLSDLSEEFDVLMKQLYHLNSLESDINLIELVFEQEPQVVLQGSLFALTLYYKRLELLSDTSFGIDLKIIFVGTWCLQVLSMIRNLLRALHRKRYPVTPGIAGMILQAISLAGLLVPKLILVSLGLLNMVYLYPFVAMSHALITMSFQKIIGNKVGFCQLLIILSAPTYYQLDRDGTIENSNKRRRKFGNGIAALLLQLITLISYVWINWILRQTVFFNNIKFEKDNSENSFLKNITEKTSFITHEWTTLILMYFGGISINYVANSIYYRYLHPWNMARGNAR